MPEESSPTTSECKNTSEKPASDTKRNRESDEEANPGADDKETLYRVHHHVDDMFSKETSVGKPSSIDRWRMQTGKYVSLR